MKTETARFVLDSLASEPPIQLEALADAIGAEGGTLHEGIAAAIRDLAGQSPTPLLGSLRLAGVRPDPGEVDALIAQLSDVEPWRTLRADLEAGDVFNYVIASDEPNIRTTSNTERTNTSD